MNQVAQKEKASGEYNISLIMPDQLMIIWDDAEKFLRKSCKRSKGRVTTQDILYQCLNNESSFESFTPETVFYVLPVIEDILRGGMLDMSSRVRRSNYSYKITGTKLRVYPVPTKGTPGKLWVRVGFSPDVLNPAYSDSSISGVSNLSNVPYGNLEYGKINSIGRQWTRQYAFSLAKELLGQVRSKFASVPIPGGDLSLNGGDLISQAREEQDKLRTNMIELLDSLTYSKLLEDEAGAAENLQTILKSIPIPNGQAIIVG